MGGWVAGHLKVFFDYFHYIFIEITVVHMPLQSHCGYTS